MNFQFSFSKLRNRLEVPSETVYSFMKKMHPLSLSIYKNLPTYQFTNDKIYCILSYYVLNRQKSFTLTSVVLVKFILCECDSINIYLFNLSKFQFILTWMRVALSQVQQFHFSFWQTNLCQYGVLKYPGILCYDYQRLQDGRSSNISKNGNSLKLLYDLIYCDIMD